MKSPSNSGPVITASPPSAYKATLSRVTLDQLQARATLLESEIEANKEENLAMQQELDALYTQIDAAKS